MLRSSEVIVWSRRLPPIFPPLRPKSAINSDICALVGQCSSVDFSTRRCASWFSSSCGFLCFFGFGMPSYWHTKAAFANGAPFKVATTAVCLARRAVFAQFWIDDEGEIRLPSEGRRARQLLLPWSPARNVYEFSGRVHDQLACQTLFFPLVETFNEIRLGEWVQSHESRAL